MYKFLKQKSVITCNGRKGAIIRVKQILQAYA